MDREKLEVLGVCVIVTIVPLLAKVTKFILLPFSAIIGLIIMSPLYWIFCKNEYGLNHLWIWILQFIITIIIHVIIAINVEI